MPLNQQGDPSIAAHHQPALVLDYARSRECGGTRDMAQVGSAGLRRVILRRPSENAGLR